MIMGWSILIVYLAGFLASLGIVCVDLGREDGFIQRTIQKECEKDKKTRMAFEGLGTHGWLWSIMIFVMLLVYAGGWPFYVGDLFGMITNEKRL